MLAPMDNPRAVVGGNHPPDAMESAQEARQALNAWLTAHPALLTLEEARAGADWLQRGRDALGELNAERDGKVRPLNSEVKRINDAYRLVSAPLSALVGECDRRIEAYRAAEKARREAEAEAARQAAAEAERMAQAAAWQRDEAVNDADVGAETDIGAAMEEAHAAERQADVAGRTAARLERDAENVVIRSNFGVAVRRKPTPEILLISDPMAALAAMGLTPKIEVAILSSARDFKKAHGALPKGITIHQQGSL